MGQRLNLHICGDEKCATYRATRGSMSQPAYKRGIMHFLHKTLTMMYNIHIIILCEPSANIESLGGSQPYIQQVFTGIFLFKKKGKEVRNPRFAK